MHSQLRRARHLRDEVDLVQDFAIALPTKVILDVLGIGHHELDRFVAVADSLISMHEPTATAETLAEADRVFRAAADVVLELADERRAVPRTISSPSSSRRATAPSG